MGTCVAKRYYYLLMLAVFPRPYRPELSSNQTNDHTRFIIVPPASCSRQHIVRTLFITTELSIILL